MRTTCCFITTTGLRTFSVRVRNEGRKEQLGDNGDSEGVIVDVSKPSSRRAEAEALRLQGRWRREVQAASRVLQGAGDPRLELNVRAWVDIPSTDEVHRARKSISGPVIWTCWAPPGFRTR